MNTYENISSELRQYFSNHSFFKLLLPLHIFIVYGCVGIIIFNNFISLGGLLPSLAYYGFLLGLLLAYAYNNKKCMYIGLFIYAGFHAFLVLKYALFVSYRFLSFGSLIAFLVFGGLGFAVFKKASIK